jgi:hypothetical protein
VVVVVGVTAYVLAIVSDEPPLRSWSIVFPCVNWHSVTCEQLYCRFDASGTITDVGLAVSGGLQTAWQPEPEHDGSDGVEVGVLLGVLLLPHEALQDESEPYCAPEETAEHALFTQS